MIIYLLFSYSLNSGFDCRLLVLLKNLCGYRMKITSHKLALFKCLLYIKRQFYDHIAFL